MKLKLRGKLISSIGILTFAAVCCFPYCLMYPCGLPIIK